MYGLGEYTPDYLSTENGSNLINETFRVLNEGVNLGLSEQVDEAFKAKLEDSVFNFSGFKTNKELEEVNSLLRDENGNLRPFEQFKQDVLKLNDKYNLNYLQAEYNMAVQSAQMASKWQDFEAHKDFVNLQYRTAGDEKVRAEHAALDGTTLPVEDKFWSEYLPPLGWNCRCTVVEVLKDKHPESNSDEAIKAGAAATSQPSQKIFRFNPGKTGEIFPPKHPYYKVGGGRGASIEVAGNVEKASQIINKTGIYGNLTTAEREAIERNNKEIEKALGIKIGVPEKDYEANRRVNPQYWAVFSNFKYKSNCATCSAAFVLRMRGFNVEAKPRHNHSFVNELSHKSLDKWLNIDGSKIDPKINSISNWMRKKNYKEMDPSKYQECINELAKDNGIYELNVSAISQGKTISHTYMLCNVDGLKFVYDPINGGSFNLESLTNNLTSNPIEKEDGDQYLIDGIERVDNKLFNLSYCKILFLKN